MLTREGQRDTKLRPTADGQEGAPSLALGGPAGGRQGLAAVWGSVLVRRGPFITRISHSFLTVRGVQAWLSFILPSSSPGSGGSYQPSHTPHQSPGRPGLAFQPVLGRRSGVQMGYRSCPAPSWQWVRLRTTPCRYRGLCRKAGNQMHLHSPTGNRSLAPPPGSPSSRPSSRKSSPWSPHRVIVSSYFILLYFTVVANKSRCKQGLFHINILTGFFCVK